MNLNPEFRRQLYLEFSLARLIGIPLLLGVVFTLTYFLDDYRLAGKSSYTALRLYWLIVLLWGARQAVDSVLDEQRNRTWDTQRLSALGPWTMVWGKLCGSALAVWYGGAICLAVYTAAVNHAHLLWTYSYAVCSGLLAQNVGLFLGLLALRHGQNNNGGVAGSAMLFAVMLGIWLITWVIEDRGFHSYGHETPIEWYGMALTQKFLHLLNLSLALLWCGAGNYRLMAQELRIRTAPWVWSAFMVFLIVYIGGFIIPSEDYGYYFTLMALVICVALTYASVLTEQNDPMRLKRLLLYAEQRNWQRLAEELPLWCVPLAAALPIALLCSVIPPPLNAAADELNLYPLPIVLLLLRDIAIYLFFCYGKNPQRALMLALLTSLLLYGLLPGIFLAAQQPAPAALFFPLWSGNAVLATVFSALQAAAVLMLLYKRWRKRVYGSLPCFMAQT